MSHFTDLSIIIPVWNKAKFTKSCLNDLIKLRVKTAPRIYTNYEIIIVDNGSTDKTEEIVNEFIKNTVAEEVLEEDIPRIKYIKLDKNYGFSKACNRGFRESNGCVVMFLNNDIKVHGDFETWPTNMALGLYNFNIGPKLIGLTGGYIDPKTFEFKYETKGSPMGTKPFNYLSAWCIIGLRETWEQLDTGDGQPFSEEFGFAFFEDTDISFRAKRLGMELSIVSAPVTHFGHTSAKQLNVSHLYRNAKKIFVKKWKNK